MPFVTRQDRSGVSFSLFEDQEGVLHAVYPHLQNHEEHMASIRNLAVRPDDVFLLGYPKSGNHWMFEILTMLLLNSDDYTAITLGESALDAVEASKLDALTSPRVLVTHYRSKMLPKQLLEKKPKILFVMRNPKDVASSLYSFVHKIHICAPYRGTFDDFFQLYIDGDFCEGSWFDYMKDFDTLFQEQPDLPVHFACYENMKENPVKEIERIASFLGVSASKERVETIAEKTDFSNMSKALKSGKLASMQHIFDDGAPGLFRKGVVGEWRNWLSAAQSEGLNEVFQKSAATTPLIRVLAEYL